MTQHINKYLIEGLDRLGKNTLIDGILNARGYYQVLHFSKPLMLNCYTPCPTGMTADEMVSSQFYEYQNRSFRTMFSLLRDAKYSNLICNRAHLGECVYAPLYRKYDGNYVFDIERSFDMASNHSTRLILLTEDFSVSEHFVDDGLSFDTTKRKQEQELFIGAFENSIIPDKRIICVTDKNTGGFRSKESVLNEALA